MSYVSTAKLLTRQPTYIMLGYKIVEGPPVSMRRHLPAGSVAQQEYVSVGKPHRVEILAERGLKVQSFGGFEV